MKRSFRSAAFTPAMAERALRDIFRGLPEGRGGFDEFAASLWDSDMHRFPVNPQHWIVFREAILTGPAIIKSSPRCSLVSEMTSAPGQAFLVADAGISGRQGLRLCMATADIGEVTRWITTSCPCRGVIGQLEDEYLMAFSILSFVNND